MFTTPAVDLVAARARARSSAATSRAGRAACAGCPSSAASCRSRRSPRRSRRRATGQIRALVTSAGNPVLSTPNGAAARARARGARLHGLDRSLPQRDHAPRARHPAAELRRSSASTTTSRFYALAVRNVAKLLAAGVRRRRPDERHDWEICLELALAPARARRRAAARALAWLRARAAAARPAARARPAAAARAARARRSRKLRARSRTASISARSSRALPERLRTPTSGSQLAPAAVPRRPRAARAQLDARRRAADADAHRPAPAALEQLVDAQQRAAREGPAACTLLMHPDDARGARARRRRARRRSRSRVGAVAAPLRVTDEMMPRRRQPAARLGARRARRRAARRRSARRARASTM